MNGIELRAKALSAAAPYMQRGGMPPGYWCISEQEWAAFQSGGLDASSYRGDLPTLLGRPLMRREDPDPDHLHYEPTGGSGG